MPTADLSPESLQTLLGQSRNPNSDAPRLLRTLADQDPQAFFRASVPLVETESDWPGKQYLLALLTSKGLAPPCNPRAASLEEEIVVAKAALQHDAHLVRGLTRRLMDSLREEPVEFPVIERITAILEAISDPVRVAPLLGRLVREADPRVKSKAAAMLVRGGKNTMVAASLLTELDPRVRANAVEGLWGSNSPEVVNLLRQAAGDPNNRVAANALLGLHKAGDSKAPERLREMAAHQSPEFRGSAAWAMGQSGDQAFLEQLAKMIRDTDPTVRRSVFRAIAHLRAAAARA